MQRRDLIIGIVVLAVIAAIVLVVQRRRQDLASVTATPIATPSLQETQDRIEDQFKIDIPEDVEKANLQDPNGGEAGGVATREVQAGVSTITVLVDLPDPEAGKFYQAWLRGGAQLKSIGTLRVAKGGFLVDFSGSGLESMNEVVVSLESTNDNQIEQVVLEGSFPATN